MSAGGILLHLRTAAGSRFKAALRTGPCLLSIPFPVAPPLIRQTETIRTINRVLQGKENRGDLHAQLSLKNPLSTWMWLDTCFLFRNMG